jgi:hypothetical protein
MPAAGIQALAISSGVLQSLLSDLAPCLQRHAQFDSIDNMIRSLQETQNSVKVQARHAYM